jgi:cell division protein FtsB
VNLDHGVSFTVFLVASVGVLAGFIRYLVVKVLKLTEQSISVNSELKNLVGTTNDLIRQHINQSTETRAPRRRVAG